MVYDFLYLQAVYVPCMLEKCMNVSWCFTLEDVALSLWNSQLNWQTSLRWSPSTHAFTLSIEFCRKAAQPLNKLKWKNILTGNENTGIYYYTQSSLILKHLIINFKWLHKIRLSQVAKIRCIKKEAHSKFVNSGTLCQSAGYHSAVRGKKSDFLFLYSK